MHSEISHEESPVPSRQRRGGWSRLFVSATSLVAGQFVEACILYAQAMHPDFHFSPPPEPDQPDKRDQREDRRRHLRAVAR